MRKIAAFRFDLEDSKINDFDKLLKEVQSWLNNKGQIKEAFDSEGWQQFDLNKSYFLESSVHAESIESSNGRLEVVKLREVNEKFILQTTIETSYSTENKVSFYLQIEKENTVAGVPNLFIIKRPILLQNILNKFKGRFSHVPSQKLDYKGLDGLKEYLDLFLSVDRQYPLIVVSTQAGEEALSEKLLDQLSYDMLATAFVCRIDDVISWKLSEKGGNQWSCFSGGIRIFWPGVNEHNNPYFHPLWTLERLKRRGNEIQEIAEGVSRMLRKQLIMDLSPFSVVPSKHNNQIKLKYQEEVFENKIKTIRGQALDAQVYEDLITEYEEQLRRYKDILRDKDNEISIIRYQLEDLGRQQVSDSAESTKEDEVSSVQDAVDKAAKKYKDSIEFSKNIEKSIKTLAENAGSPSKILECFEKLDVLTEKIIEAGDNGIGQTHLRWLKDEGVKCSGESETTKKNAKAQEKRTFLFTDNKKISFDKHMKLGDATDIKHCVRIYFEWDESKQKFLIGYVGEHLD